ncbi:hypothetical protein Csa_023732, partial [Cucumis sativus]
FCSSAKAVAAILVPANCRLPVEAEPDRTPKLHLQGCRLFIPSDLFSSFRTAASHPKLL